MSELISSSQSCLARFLLGILIFKGVTTRRLYKSFGVKGLNESAWPGAVRTFGEGRREPLAGTPTAVAPYSVAIVPRLAVPRFATLSHNRHDFRENVAECKCMFWFRLVLFATFIKIIYIIRRI
jgi:hypothetical protein